MLAGSGMSSKYEEILEPSRRYTDEFDEPLNVLQVPGNEARTVELTLVDLPKETTNSEENKQEKESILASEIQEANMEEEEDTESLCGAKELMLLCLFGSFNCIGLLWFMAVDGFTFIESLYYITIIFTTVGYGIEDGLNKNSYRFLVFYCIMSVAIVGTSFSVLADHLVASMFKQRKEIIFHHYADNEEEKIEDEVEENDTKDTMTHKYFGSYLEKCGCGSTGITFLFWLILTVGGGLIVAQIESWDWEMGIYFAVISGSTIGFGDFSPATEEGMLFVFFWLPTLVVYTMYIFSQLFLGFMVQVVSRQEDELSVYKKNMHRFLNKKNIVKRLHQLDLNGDGVVTRDEFVIACLCVEHNIEKSRMQFLRQYYSKELDLDGSGEVTMDDVALFLKGDPKEKVNYHLDVPTSNSHGGRFSSDEEGSIKAIMINDAARRDWNPNATVRRTIRQAEAII